jgi:exopolyphosphatase/guanosine-5'-triphosphate,3'-diphosphate pyrophosphatase
MPHSSQNPNPPEVIAAVDLGSNSFHMIVARVANGDIQVVDRLREMVRLGAGLDKHKHLTPEAWSQAIACLERFGQRVRDLPPGAVRAVGTNTLRQTRKAEQFLEEARAALGHPIEIISGHEEARLIYLGVAHGLAAGEEQRLVVDIGGGSTELIIGKGFDAQHIESLYMGCVSMSRSHFSSGRISSKAMDNAELAAALELRPIRREFRHIGWQAAIGSSGTIRSIKEVVRNAGWSEAGITLESLQRLRQALIDFGHIDRLQLEGLKAERHAVFPGGVAILLAVFKSLRIKQMRVSDEALREGLLYEMLGRSRHEDVQERTIASLCSRYGVEVAHAQLVEQTALALFGQVADAWGLDDQHAAILGWAARLHEIGLALSHSQFHKHGAYLIANSDLSGFSRQEQAQLGILVKGHRRKFPAATEFAVLPAAVQDSAKRLCILLRLAVLLHRGRSTSTSRPTLTASGGSLKLTFNPGWLASHPLTRMELSEETTHLKRAAIKLDFS